MTYLYGGLVGEGCGSGFRYAAAGLCRGMSVMVGWVSASCQVDGDDAGCYAIALLASKQWHTMRRLVGSAGPPATRCVGFPV